VQIAESLLDQIESGGLSPGDRLPAERKLSEMLGVNRMTLRQALQLLVLKGLLVRRQGAGTYVAEPQIKRDVGRLVPFARGIAHRGYTAGVKVISFERRPVDVSVAQELRLSVATPVYDVQRLRLINREPVMLESAVLPVYRFPNLEQFDLTKRSVYAIVEAEYGVRISRVRQSLEPVIATAHEAEWLSIEHGAPLMLERHVTVDQHRHPVAYGKVVYRGDRFRFMTETAPFEPG
jgi:GntR family transcriptional regulator